MADENTLRSYRAKDPYGNEASPSGRRERAPSSDPLAELARLIGQTDPFAASGSGQVRNDRRDPSHFAVGTPQGGDAWRRNAPPSDYDTDYQAELQPALPEPPPFPPATVPRHEHLASPSSYGLPADPYGDPHDHVYVQDQQHYDEDRFEASPAVAPYASETEYADQAYYEDNAPMEAQDEEMYDDSPTAHRRSGLLTVLTLVGCAMLGTAGAYGYRAYYVGGGTRTPPIIVADKTPVKVVPPSEAQSSKAIQDRVGDRSGNERMVSHEEQPMELPPAGTQSAPRVVLPAPVAPMPNTATAVFPPPPATVVNPSSPPAAAPEKSQATAPSAPAARNEPKRVHTVTIRSDGGESNARPGGSYGPAGSSPAPRAAQQSRGNPLSLNPGSDPSPSTSRATAFAAPAPRVAPAPSTSGEGGYVVQVSSQRSEAEAHASFRAMQSKYRSVLGDQQAIIRRADLGARGTYYRAMVGPFASSAEAGHLCSALKAAGGQCFIVRN